MLTHTEEKLIQVLRDIWDDKEFVLGVLTDLETDEERQAVLDYIQHNDGVTTEDIVLLALHIDNERA
jgi:hypothetical protein